MKTKTLIKFIISIQLVFISTLSAEAKSDRTNLTTNLGQSLERLSQQLDSKRKDFHIPGMAIAIVKDGKIILSKGFGVSNLESQKAVTSKTVFGIGSTTKAFTATLIGMLVDEGKMKWDDPITKYLPYLQFDMKNTDDVITIRDMLSHQTGFARFSILYANGRVSRDEVLHAAIKAKPWSGFREKFIYTNLMVSAAGVAAAHSSHKRWENLLKTRILKPLRMKNTTANYNQAMNNPLMSSGYMWLEEQNKHKKLNMHNITNIGPAGAIDSNVDDMAHWIQLQLGNGKYKGKQLISSAQIEETRTPQIKVSSSASYGLGWMLRDYKGQKLVAHDGSVEGFSAIVALLPESNIGYVLLTNVTQSGMLGTSMNMVFEALLGDSNDVVVSEKVKANTYDKFVGEYIANFATFKDTIFKFHLKDGTPYVNVPGQMDYELKAPNENGKMYFAVTDTVSISFDRNEMGDISAMRMQQGSMNFEIPKKGVEIKPEIDETMLQKYLGKYKSKLFKGDLTVKIQNHRLAVAVPGEMTFELHVPDAQGHRHFRVKDNMSVVFENDSKNKVKALSVYKGDKNLDTAQRILSTTVKNLPSVADIMKLGQSEKRIKALLKSNGFRIKGFISMQQSGVQGTITSSFEGYSNFREEVDFGRYGSIITTLNEKNAAINPSFSDFMEQHGKYYEQTLKSQPAALIDWQHYYEHIEVVSEEEFNHKKVYVLNLSGGKTPNVKMTVDAENGDILQIESKMFNPTMGSIPVTRQFENYQEVHGIRFPYKIIIKNNFSGKSIIEVKSIENNLNFSSALFKQTNAQLGE